MATVELTVGTQPGDNYKAAASVTATYLNAVVIDTVNLKDGTGVALPTDNAKVTDLLTVWRTVHIERDSMGVVTGNTVSGNIVALLPAGASNTTAKEVTVSNDLDDGSKNLDSAVADNGRFEKGEITVAGVNVIAALDGNGNKRVAKAAGLNITSTPLPFAADDGGILAPATLSGTVTGITQAGGNYTLILNVTAHSGATIDWANLPNGGLIFPGGITIAGGPRMRISSAAGNPNGPTGGVTVTSLAIPYTMKDDDLITGDVPDPDIGGMASIYKPAYVVPVADTGKDTPNAAFALNSPDAVSEAQITASKGVQRSTDEYWVVTLLNGYQTSLDHDNDPDREGTDRAAAWRTVDGVIFGLESIRDWIATTALDAAGKALGGKGVDPASAGRQTRIQEIINHEVGHLFGLEHDDGLKTADDPNGGVMNPSCCPPDDPANGTRGASTFTQLSLSKIRTKTHPGGGPDARVDDALETTSGSADQEPMADEPKPLVSPAGPRAGIGQRPPAIKNPRRGNMARKH